MDVRFIDQHTLGLAGELQALTWYEERGYECLEHRRRCRSGELDLVVRAPDGVIVFVEVKTRRSRAFGGVESVNARKFATLRRCATEWLQAMVPDGYVEIRFDIVEIIYDPERGMQLAHYEGIEDGAC